MDFRCLFRGMEGGGGSQIFRIFWTFAILPLDFPHNFPYNQKVIIKKQSNRRKKNIMNTTTIDNGKLIEFIARTAEEYWYEYSLVYNCGELPPIEYTNNKTRIAGKAYRINGKDKVSFNLRFAEEKEYYNTIAHELAHIIQFRLFPNALQAHGAEFRSIMASIGANPNTYHYYSVAAAKSKRVQKIMAYDLVSADEM